MPFEQGETIILDVEITSTDTSSAVDADTEPNLKIDCSNSYEVSGAMTRESKGSYTFSWDIPSDASVGKYDITYTAEKNNNVAIEKDEFWVVEK